MTIHYGYDQNGFPVQHDPEIRELDFTQIAKDNAGKWSSYPFVEDGEPARFVIDAQIGIADQHQGKRIALDAIASAIGGGPKIEISADGADLVTYAEDPTVTVWGAYEIWEYYSADLTVILTVDPTVSVNVAAQDLEFVPNVVTYVGTPGVMSVAAGVEEAATSGEVLELAPGSHIVMDAEETAEGLDITINAEYVQDGPCVPANLAGSADTVQQFGGAVPDDRGEISFRPSECITARIGADQGDLTRTISNGCVPDFEAPVGRRFLLEIENICGSCCDCEDYARVFELIKATHDRMSVLNDWNTYNITLLRTLIADVKRLLGRPVLEECD